MTTDTVLDSKYSPFIVPRPAEIRDQRMIAIRQSGHFIHNGSSRSVDPSGSHPHYFTLC